MLVILAETWRHIFSSQVAGEKIGHVITCVGAQVETRTVKWIEKTGRVTHCRPAVVANFFTMIRQHRQGMHIALDDPRGAEDLAANRIAENVCVQAFAQARSFGKFEDTAVVNDSSTDIAAVQWNDPAPPAMSHEMVRRP